MKIVVLDGYRLNPGDNPWTELDQHGDVVVHDRSTRGEAIARAADAEVIVVNKVAVTAEMMDQLPNLKMVALTSTGYDCVDIKAAKEHGVTVCNVPVYGTDSVAQFVFALLLQLCHHVGLHDTAIREGEWEQEGDFSFWKTQQIELAGRTMGIIGFGRIGHRVGELANAFGMHVLATKRSEKPAPEYQPFEWVEQDELIARSDVISLHCSLNDQTRGMVDAGFLKRAKTTAMLINTSRGDLVVEADLTAALNNDQFGAAGLDVATQEPIQPDNPLLTAKNCIITPHMAWATLSARQRLMKSTIDNVAAFVRGQPTNVVGD